MRFVFKTSYAQDLRPFKDGVQASWYLALLGCLLVAPFVLPDYLRTQVTFIFIYAVVGFGLMLLSGFTGQLSMGHAAFLAIGAYTEAILQNQGVPFVLSAPIAMLLSSLAGVAIGLPALRLTGIYLAIATLSFGFIVEEALARFDWLTGGNSGMMLVGLNVVGFNVEWDYGFYYLALVCTVLWGWPAIIFCVLRPGVRSWRSGIRRYLRRAWGQPGRIQDAQFCDLCGVHRVVAGALYAHKIQFIPEQFNLFVSIEFLMMIVIGGMDRCMARYSGRSSSSCCRS
ncbi:MAG: branched-chain amino acid ABC transporter permease [Burkholderiaceae bacterium]